MPAHPKKDYSSSLLGINPETGDYWNISEFCRKYDLSRRSFYYFLAKKHRTPKKALEAAEEIYKKTGINLSHYYHFLLEDSQREIQRLLESTPSK